MADYLEKKVIEVNASLREVIHGFIFYHPWWIKVLFRLRGVLAFLLGLRHENGKPEVKNPREISFNPGDKESFFTVVNGIEDFYWAAATPDDKHLQSVLTITKGEGAGGKTTFEFLTIVTYLHWTGRLYFSLIKPFHLMIMLMMLRHLKRKF